MAEKTILETAVVIIGSLGREKRFISCKFGQSVGKFMIMEATTNLGGRGASNPKEMEVVVGERNNGMNEINDFSTLPNLRVVRFGSKGSLIV